MEKELNSIQIQEILKLLPHRYPFLLIDKVIDYTPKKSIHAIKNISMNEPCFQGHFPEKPIFPGVLILEAMAQATGILGFKSNGEPKDNELYYFAGIDNVRFKQPVVPGDVIHFKMDLIRDVRGIGKFTGTAKVDDKIVCKADLMCARREY